MILSSSSLYPQKIKGVILDSRLSYIWISAVLHWSIHPFVRSWSNIYQTINLSVHPSNSSSNHASIYIFHLFFNPSIIHLFMHWFIHSFTYPAFHHPIHPSMHLSTYSFTHAFVGLSVHPSIYPSSVYLFIICPISLNSSIYPSIGSLVPPSIHLFIHPSYINPSILSSCSLQWLQVFWVSVIHFHFANKPPTDWGLAVVAH